MTNEIRKIFYVVCEYPDGYDNIRKMADTFIATGDNKEPIIYNMLTKKWDKIKDKIKMNVDYGSEETVIRWKATFNKEKKNLNLIVDLI